MANRKMSMADYIREMNYRIPMERICRNLGIPGISDGHLCDQTTIVEVNAKGQVLWINGEKPKTVALDRAEENEYVPEEVAEEIE